MWYKAAVACPENENRPMHEWRVLAKPSSGKEYWAWEGKLPG